jgi:hypothetical protein
MRDRVPTSIGVEALLLLKIDSDTRYHF